MENEIIGLDNGNEIEDIFVSKFGSANKSNDEKYSKIPNHHFNVGEAVQYGVNKAILLNNIRFWLIKNKANDTHKKEINNKTYYWTYNSGIAFGKLFPYFKSQKILRLLLELEKDGVLLSGNFNKFGYDKTKWYTIKDEFEV